MGLRNDVWSIKQSIDQQAQTSASKSEKKYKRESDVLIKLEYYIRKYKDFGQDVYNVNVQDEIIVRTLRSVFGELQNQLDASNPTQFVENYQTMDQRVDEDYYYLFCMRHYLASCRNVENYIKNEMTKEKQAKEQLQNEILQLKKLQEAEKLRKLQDQAQARQQKQIATKKGGNDATWIILAIIFFPLAIIYGFISAACKTVK